MGQGEIHRIGPDQFPSDKMSTQTEVMRENIVVANESDSGSGERYVVSMAKTMKGTVEQLRRAIQQAERRGMSRYAIAKGAGIRLPMLIRIANGANIPRLDTAEKIVRALGGRLTVIT